MLEKFWNSPVDFDHPVFEKNNSLFIVTQDTPMSKIHFLYTMLNINLLIVLKEGEVKGVIAKSEFIHKRKSAVLMEDKIKRKERRAIEMANRK